MRLRYRACYPFSENVYKMCIKRRKMFIKWQSMFRNGNLTFEDFVCYLCQVIYAYPLILQRSHFYETRIR